MDSRLGHITLGLFSLGAVGSAPAITGTAETLYGFSSSATAILAFRGSATSEYGFASTANAKQIFRGQAQAEFGFSSTATALTLSGNYVPAAERTLVVPDDVRSYLIASESRILAIPQESRVA